MRTPDRESKRAAIVRAIRRGDDAGQIRRNTGASYQLIRDVADAGGLVLVYELSSGRETRRQPRVGAE